MELKEGQGIFGRFRFVDGEYPKYDRPYLIVGVTENYVELLNVSSVKGKERKLAFKTNKRIVRYKPPFTAPSFVKLDSLIRVSKNEIDDSMLLMDGKTLDQTEYCAVKNLLDAKK